MKIRRFAIAMAVAVMMFVGMIGVTIAASTAQQSCGSCSGPGENSCSPTTSGNYFTGVTGGSGDWQKVNRGQ